MDPGAARGRTPARLFQRLALGRQGRQGHAGTERGITMNETLARILAWAAGGALGGMFFGGLWWTVRKAVSSKRPALWFLGSLVLRMTIAVTGFYVSSGGHADRLLLCLLGCA